LHIVHDTTYAYKVSRTRRFVRHVIWTKVTHTHGISL
jgi:hypothetical protein